MSLSASCRAARRQANLSALLHDSAWQDILVLAAVPASIAVNAARHRGARPEDL